MIVADVNLVAYLLLGGAERQMAHRVMQGDPAWVAPLLWRSEFRSVLAAHMRQRELAVSEALRVHLLADELFVGREFPVSAERVLGLVARSTCTAYDCEYVALAQELAVPLVTADKQVLRAFPDHTCSLKDFASGKG
jgi:predicted nucleic acid-binding protein